MVDRQIYVNSKFYFWRNVAQKTLKVISKRQQQIAKIIQQQLGEVFQREGFNIFGKAMVTVTSVWVSPDQSIARAYLSIFNTDHKQNTLEIIKQNKHQIKRSLVQRIRNKMRKMPELEFFLDETLDEVFKIENLLSGLSQKPKEEEE